jgi:hypothetical protein
VAVTIGSDIGSGPSADTPVIFWDAMRHAQLVTIKGRPLGIATVTAFSKDGRRLICGTIDGKTVVWEH